MHLYSLNITDQFSVSTQKHLALINWMVTCPRIKLMPLPVSNELFHASPLMCEKSMMATDVKLTGKTANYGNQWNILKYWRNDEL